MIVKDVVKGELDDSIFPKVELRCFRAKNQEGNSIIKYDMRTYVPIQRDNDTYLIPFVTSRQLDSLTDVRETIDKDMKEAALIQKKYIIPKGGTIIAPLLKSRGLELYIYKVIE